MPSLTDVFVSVRPDTRNFSPELRRDLSKVNAKDSGTRVGRSFSQGFGGAVAGLAATLGLAKLGSATASFLKDSITESSNLNETIAKSNNIFGKNAAAITQWSKQASTAFGLSQSQALSAAAQFGNMFLQLGFTGKAATKASTSIVKTAADLGSFNNIDPSDVLERIGGALRGEYDSLQLLIPNINAARVEQEALTATGKDAAKELTAQEKATATLAIIQRDGAKAANDFAETSGGLANRQRQLRSGMADLKVIVGDQLRPALETLATVGVTKLLPFFTDMAEKYGPSVGEFLSTAAVQVGNLVDSLEGGPKPETAANLGKISDAFGKLGPGISDAKDNLPSFNDTLSVASVVIGFLADNLDTLTKLLPVFAAGYLAVKTAQVAANAAATVSIPLRVAELIANRRLAVSQAQLTAAILAQTGALGTSTVAQVGNNAAQNAGILASVRQRIAAIASGTAQKVVAAATIAWTAAQWLLNAALSANPIALVILGLAALGVAITVAWKKSETFRSIVTGAWDGIKSVFASGVRSVANFMIDFAEAILGGADSAFGWFPGLSGKIETAKEKLADFKDSVNRSLGGINDKNVKVTASVNDVASSLVKAGFSRNDAQKQARQIGLAKGGPVYGPGTGTSDSITARLSKGEHVLTAREVKAAGGHDAISSWRRGLRGFAKGGPVTDFNLEARIPRSKDIGTVAERLSDRMDRVAAVIQAATSRGLGRILGFAGGGPWRRPLSSYRISSPFGMRTNPVTGSYRLHDGIDLAAPSGRPIYSASSGRVSFAGYSGGYGNYVNVQHAGGVRTGYAHMSSMAARVGQIVAAGGRLGSVGSTGNSTGPHLHFNIKTGSGFTNPSPFMSSRGAKLDSGGYLPPGYTSILNGTGQAERVRTRAQEDEILSAIRNQGQRPIVLIIDGQAIDSSLIRVIDGRDAETARDLAYMGGGGF